MALFGRPDVEEMKAKRDVNRLVEALGYKGDWHVREAAATALGEVGDPKAVESLLTAALHDEKWGVRQSAAEALACI